jgi:glycerophosphoryl diester phosphodiesterase
MIKLLFIVISLSAFAKKPQVVAHRGASGYLPEHTLEAVAMGHAMNVDFLEPDLVLSRDNVLVVLHDIHIDTTTNVAKVFPARKRKDGRYFAIDFTVEELKQLKVNERINLKTGKPYFPKRFPVGKSSFEIPTFAEYIELVQGMNKSRGMKVGIIPEMKAPEFHTKEGKDIAKETIRILRKYGYEKNGQAVLQCFYPPTLKRIARDFKTKIPLLQLIADDSWKESSANYKSMLTENGIKDISKYASHLGPWFPQLVEKKGKKWAPNNVMKWAKAAGLTVMPYTHRLEQTPPGFSSDEEFQKFLFKVLKIDGVFSDFPDKVLR